MKSDLKIFLADDHNLFRKGLGSLLRTFDRVSVVREASNGRELLALFKDETPDLAIVDLQMPVMDGAEACEQILAKWPSVKLIVLSMHDSERYISYMVEMGVHGFLPKNANVEELKRALYAVVDNDFYRNELVVNALKSHMRIDQSTDRPFVEGSQLTRREREILKLIYEECTIHEIGTRLSISENTVRNHRVNIMKKAGVSNIVGLVKYAYAAGIVLEN